MRSAAGGFQAIIWVWGLGLAFSFGCGDPCSLTTCDIRARSCQQKVMEAVVCLREGEDTSLPKVSVVSPKQYLERIRGYESEDLAEQAEREADYAAWTRGLALFDLAPKEYTWDDAVDDGVATIAASYFSDERDVLIVDRGHSMSSERAVSILAHEFVHVLQDRELNLEKYRKRHAKTFDAALAIRALTEGEATFYDMLVSVELEGRTSDEIDWMQWFAAWQSETLLSAEEDEAPVELASIRFPYAFGGGFVAQHWLARGRAGIDKLFDSPPATTSEVMFGSDRSDLDAAAEELAEHAWPVLPEQYDERWSASFGAWIARIHAARQGLDVPDRLEPARKLGADYLTVQHDTESGAVVGSWRVRMTSAAEEWPGLMNPKFDLTDIEERDAILIAADPDLSDAPDALDWRPQGDPEDGDESESEDARGRFESLPYRACAVGRPSGW